MTEAPFAQRSPSGRTGLAILCAAGAPALLVAPFGSIFLALPVFVVAPQQLATEFRASVVRFHSTAPLSLWIVGNVQARIRSVICS